MDCNHRKRAKRILLTLAITFTAACMHAETFRVHKTVEVPVSQPEKNITVKAGINDAIFIRIPEDSLFIQGIEIQVKIPAPVAEYRNTIIYSLYNGISQLPAEKTIDYSATELYTGIYPGQLSWNIQVPLVKGNTIKKTPYSDKTLIPDTKGGFIFMRNQLAMKGVPQSVMKAQFEVSARIIQSDKGGLKISASYPEEETDEESKNFSLTIDEKPQEHTEGKIYFLKPGIHNISLTSEYFRNEHRTVIIEEAKISELHVKFESLTPVIQLSLPETAVFTIDGEKKISTERFQIPAGEHTFKFEYAGQEIMKNVIIQQGKVYKISLSIDALINEESSE